MTCRILILLAALASTISSHGATITAASPAESDVSTAVGLASAGDTIAIPAGSATWTSTLTVTKALTFQGAGTNATTITINVANGGGQQTICGLYLHGGGAGATNIVTGIAWTSAAFTSFAPAVSCDAGSFVRVYGCLFTNFRNTVWVGGPFGSVDSNTFSDCHVCVQDYGIGAGCANWATYYPIAFNSLNYLFVENNLAVLDSGMNQSIGNSHAFCSSGQGSSMVVRFNTNTISANQQYAPYVDWHGDANDGTRGSLSAQVYMNKITASDTASIDKFAAARGGQGLVYSNVVTCTPGFGGRGVVVSEEWPSGTSACGSTVFDTVTNQWQWANTINGAAFSNTSCDSTGPACAMTSYSDSTYGGSFAQTYPYPWASPPPSPPNTPTNVSPASGAVNVSVTPLLSATPYNDPNPSAQQASQWVVKWLGNTVWSATLGAVTNATVGVTLGNSVTYSYSVRYENSLTPGLWSPWSPPTLFTTKNATTTNNPSPPTNTTSVLIIINPKSVTINGGFQSQ